MQNQESFTKESSIYHLFTITLQEWFWINSEWIFYHPPFLMQMMPNTSDMRSDSDLGK